ncbi:class I SAM-dependent methyltransferase, partial [bacterium]|nr:class I SAM-dependent methyltransferase [bacterium]
PVHKLEDEFIYNYLLQNGYVSGDILDLGCGTAPILDHLLIPEGKYHGIDVSNEMIIRAKAKHPGQRFDCVPMEKFSFNRQYHNIISLFGSFSYADPFMTVLNICDHLKPGGRFFIMAFGKRYRKRKSYIMNFLGIPSNASYYSSTELKSHFYGFQDIKVRGLTLSEYMANNLPAAISKHYFRSETQIAGRLSPDNCYFLIITGEKSAEKI